MTETKMGEMRLVGGSGRLPIIRDIVREALGDNLDRMVPDGFTAGDTRIVWDTARADDIEGAKASYDKLIEKGYRAYKVGRDSKKTGDPLDKFDPDAGAIIMVPQMSGGATGLRGVIESYLLGNGWSGENDSWYHPTLGVRPFAEAVDWQCRVIEG